MEGLKSLELLGGGEGTKYMYIKNLNHCHHATSGTVNKKKKDSQIPKPKYFYAWPERSWIQ